MTRRILNITVLWLFLLLAAFLASCGENLYEASNIPQMRQYVYMVPDGYSGTIQETNLHPIVGASAERGQSVRFEALYSINNEMMYNNDAALAYKSILWKIDGEYFNLNAFRYTFKRSGIIEGMLQTVDEFDDTLFTNFTIRVNTPEEFTLVFPYDGYNQAEPSKPVDFPLRWTLNGIDEWEYASCGVYISTDKDSVWSNQVGEIDCGTTANLWGPLVGDSAMLYQKGIDLRKESITFYWGVKYTIYVDGAMHSRKYSKINHFSTKFLDDNLSTLSIPIKYLNYYNTENPNSFKTVAHIVSATGDTLKTYTGSSYNQEILYNFRPQKGVKVYFEEQSKKDYVADSIVVDLLPGTATQTDTVYFRDTQPPQIAPTRETFLLNFNPTFHIYDDGSGINPSKISLQIDNKAVQPQLDGNELYVDPSYCYTQCFINIYAEDYAGNKLPSIDWLITKNESGFYHLRRAL
ncbi:MULTISPECIES: hypothetical protein [unclassified Fibrobacter]|uniref:hypothetical protein n=1 Tax=unclassified Fibrobacter TaxID=2634177 RepID=UPI000D6B66C7|nr:MULTISPECIES: hypothetical protein [unclassified Fibrobacter]PWJ60749.1 hypothetical protein BGX12_13619 [Fibrobacter sp. UWR4]PZW64365.1 hypothetical protein C8E88_103819 [Fibrobacter sp. UWR1]